MNGLQSLLNTGTRLWLDSIDPELVPTNKQWGITGATSNPAIVADLIRTGRFDPQIEQLIGQGINDDDVAWRLTDQLVRDAQLAFLDIWQETDGDDGYVSFELDPLLEDDDRGLSHEERVRQYVELGQRWSAGHNNRLIKVPATPAGIDSLSELAAAGVPLNVTLIFTSRQYQAAREAIWQGVQKAGLEQDFKSVYSVFVSRIDVYVNKHIPDLSEQAQGQVAVINAKQIWRENQQFWRQKSVRLRQEIVFASTGTKDPNDDQARYVEALAGSDIQTNPPATNEFVHQSSRSFSSQLAATLPAAVLDEIGQRVDMTQLEVDLMDEGLAKFSQPQKDLLNLVAQKRSQLVT